MNKSELIFEIGRKINLSSADIEDVLNAAIKIITAELKQGGKVQIIGFGTFSVRDRAAHINALPRARRSRLKFQRTSCRISSPANRSKRKSTEVNNDR